MEGLHGVIVLVLLAFCAPAKCYSPGNTSIASVTYDPNTKLFKIVGYLADDWIAWANFTDTKDQTGWSHLEITTNSSYSDELQSYAAGLVEGSITSTLIYYHWLNTVAGYCDSDEAFCNRLRAYIEENLAWMQSKIDSAAGKVPYWHQVSLLLTQLQGVEDGYKNALSRKPKLIKEKLKLKLDPMGVLMFNIFGDLEDLEAALNKTSLKRIKGSGSCSALIKVLEDQKDIYVSHVTWNNYNSMLRLMKKYNLGVHYTKEEASPIIDGHTMAFSSYPGTIFSGDDFYITSAGLVSLETTIGNGNNSLWQYVKARGTVLEWIRNQVANRLASTGLLWSQIFSLYNSGTYNNQWMVVDFNLFPHDTPNESLPDGLLYVLEQLPGNIKYADQTSVLRNQGYWPSYNSPFYPEIFNMSGAPESVAQFGDWFTYDKTPRALIFKRDQGSIKDEDSMIKMMRYNDYQNDPLSSCNCTPPYSAENAISARSDLNPINGQYPFGSLGHRPHGATDMKMTSFAAVWKYEITAIAGPTYDPLPPFQWSTSDYDETLQHMGHPDLWQFQPIKTRWNGK